MRLATVLTMLSLVSIGLAADPQFQGAPQDPQFAKNAFRSAINAWAYSEYWRLYAMGTKESRDAISEKDFAVQMEQGWRKPGIGLEILDVGIRGAFAAIRAKVRMEYGKFAREAIRNRPIPSGPTDEIIQSVLTYQDNDWRVNLYQFVGMARY